MTVRVVLADDQAVVRAGFRALLDLTDDLVVVAEAAGGLQTVEAVRMARPDVVLMDIRMPGIDGIDATRRTAADRTLDGVRVVTLTTYQVDEYVFEALRHGAAGFLLKETSSRRSARQLGPRTDGGGAGTVRPCCRGPVYGRRLRRTGHRSPGTAGPAAECG
jgi:DNA-binding NarL/FixJ family response regulator